MSDWEVVPGDWEVVDGPQAETPNPASVASRRFASGKAPLPRSMTADADVSDVAIPREQEPISGPEVYERTVRGFNRMPGMINSAIDRASFGGLSGVMRLSGKINESLGREPYDPITPGIEQYREDFPRTSAFTDAPAYFTKPTTAVVEASNAAINAGARLLPNVVRAASRSIPRQTAVAKNAATAALAGGTIGGTQEAIAGGGPGDVARAMLSGGADAASLGTGLSIAARPITGAANAVIDSVGGRARRFIEERGGPGARVGMTTPGSGGKFDEMATLGTSDADIGLQGEVSARRGLEMLNEKHGSTQGAIGKRIGEIDTSGPGFRQRDISHVVANMEDASRRIGVGSTARTALKDQLELIRTAQKPGFNPDVDPWMLSESELNGLKRELDGLARTGQSTEAKYHSLRSAADDVRAMVNEGPYRDVNAEYATAKRGEQKDRRLLGIVERNAKPEEPETSVNKVKNAITRRGQNTVTAGGQQDRLQRFENRNPEIGEEFVRPELLRKRADISFRALPKRHGGLIERGGSIAGSLGLLEAAAHMMGHGHVSVPQMLGGIASGLTLQNLPAIQARLLYNPALALQAAEPMLLGEIPQVAAARAAREDRP